MVLVGVNETGCVLTAVDVSVYVAVDVGEFVGVEPGGR